MSYLKNNKLVKIVMSLLTFITLIVFVISLVNLDKNTGFRKARKEFIATTKESTLFDSYKLNDAFYDPFQKQVSIRHTTVIASTNIKETKIFTFKVLSGETNTYTSNSQTYLEIVRYHDKISSVQLGKYNYVMYITSLLLILETASLISLFVFLDKKDTGDTTNEK